MRSIERELIPFDLWTVEGQDLIKLAYQKPVGHADCNAELAVSSLAVAQTIASADCTESWRDS